MKYTVVTIEDDIEFAELQMKTINTFKSFMCLKYYLNTNNFLKDNLKSIDIILLDLILPELDGLSSIIPISNKYPNASIVINSIRQDTDTILKAIKLGAVGYVDKQNFFDYIENVLNSVINEGAFITPKVAKKIMEYFHNQKVKINLLTVRESQVAMNISEGLSYKLVADKLNVSIDTIRMNIRNIYKKLNIHSKTELVKFVLDNKNKFH